MNQDDKAAFERLHNQIAELESAVGTLRVENENLRAECAATQAALAKRVREAESWREERRQFLDHAEKQKIAGKEAAKAQHAADAEAVELAKAAQAVAS